MGDIINWPDPTDVDRNLSILTKADRKFLLEGGRGYDRRQRSDRKQSIVPRARNALVDFSLMVGKDLAGAPDLKRVPEEWLPEIIPYEQPSEVYIDVLRDIASAIEFCYVGLRGEREFRTVLDTAVTEGEIALGNADNRLEVHTHFAVNPHRRRDARGIVDAIEHREWDRLKSPDLYQFLKLATGPSLSGSIDFERIHNHLDSPEPAEVTLQTGMAQSRRVELDIDTIQRLDRYRDEGETWDDVVNHLLDALGD